MKAIILAAGFGGRMSPLTNDLHKTLLTVGEKTIIERIVDGLLENNVNNLTIVTGYNAEQLEKYLKEKYPKVSITYVHNPKYRQTNNVYSLSLAFSLISFDEDILLIESDLVYEPAVIKRLLLSPHGNVALLSRYRCGMDGTVVNLHDGVVTEVIPPHLQHDKFDFTDKYKTLNIYKFTKEFCQSEFKQLLNFYAETIDDNCYYELILGILVYMKKETIYAEILEDEAWSEIDDPNDLKVSEYVFSPTIRTKLLEDSFGGFWRHDMLDFFFIRNMYFPGTSIISELRNCLPGLMHNYGSRQGVLNEKLSYFVQCRQNNVVALNGASQIYPILKEYFTGKKVLLPEITFGEYDRCFEDGCKYSDKFGFNLTEIEDKGRLSEVVVFVNPNNPTGSVLSTDWIYGYALNNQQKTILVDESFIEFSSNQSIVTLLEKKPLVNVIVLKSLSKVLGIPGVRLGYVYSCDSAFISMVNEKLPIWNLNSMAEYFLEILIKHRSDLAQSYSSTILDREQFARQLEGVKIVDKVFKSGGNFLLIRLSRDIIKAELILNQLLERHSIYVKDVSRRINDGKGYFRLAVRLPNENAKLVKCLKEMENV